MASHSACSYETTLHEEYEAIRGECDPWILALTEPPSPAAAQFWVDCVFPWFFSMAYPGCPAERVVHITKILTWFFFFDNEADDPAHSGSNAVDAAAGTLRRHQLILSCCAGEPPRDGVADARTMKQMWALHEVVQAMLKNISPSLHARMLESLKDYLNAITIQCHYRSSGHVPTLEEYIAMRRPDSLMYFAYQLIEYGLGIELDQETLNSDLFLQLLAAAVEHVGLTNDVFSCHVERFSDDQINLPCVILFNARDPAFTFEDAMEQALCVLEEVDARYVRLMAEVQKSSLIHKPGFAAYVRTLETNMAGNKAWSQKTARYKSKLSPADERVVLDVLQPAPGVPVTCT
nr:microbial terpene synthase-like protein 9 [Dryopteris fragrans]